MRPSIKHYFAAARMGRHSIWAWIFGFFNIVIIWLVAGGIMYAVAYGLKPDLDPKSLTEYILLMASFMPLFFGTFLVYKHWHKIPALRLLTSARIFRWGYLFRAMLAMIIVSAGFILFEAIFYPEELNDLTLHPDLSLFFKATLVSLIFIPFQAASEEIFLRGYLNQALIKYLRSPWLVFILTSALFASMHLANPEADGQVLPYMSLTFMFGIAACVLLYFEGGLESAIGLHIMNNYYAFSVIGYEDPELMDTALFFTGEPVITWTDTGWEALSLTLIVVLTLWMNRRASLKQSRLSADR